MPVPYRKSKLRTARAAPCTADGSSAYGAAAAPALAAESNGYPIEIRSCTPVYAPGGTAYNTSTATLAPNR